MGKLIDRTGETRIASNGQKMTIVKYFNTYNIDVEFEDGTIASTDYKRFKKGYVLNPNKPAKIGRPLGSYKKVKTVVIDKQKEKTTRVGETRTATNGQKMTIVEYKNANDVVVEFEDGTRIKARYQNFKKGMVKNPVTFEKKEKISLKESPIKELRIGETSFATNGQKMVIIEYRNSMDLDVQFEDGTIKRGVVYHDFKIGNIRNPNKLRFDRTGESAISLNGQKMTIIKYYDSSCMDVQFEDGTIKKGVAYYKFKKGKIQNPNIKKPHNKEIKSNRVGKSVIATNGQKLTIIGYHRSNNVDVQFEDETICRGISYARFCKGHVRNPNKPFSSKKVSRKGEATMATNGQKMTIIEYHNRNNIDVQFEDGTIRKHISYRQFCSGRVHNPNKSVHETKSSIVKASFQRDTVSPRNISALKNKVIYPDFIIADINAEIKIIDHPFQLDEDVNKRLYALEGVKRQYTHSAILNQLLRDGLSKYGY